MCVHWARAKLLSASRCAGHCEIGNVLSVFSVVAQDVRELDLALVRADAAATHSLVYRGFGVHAVTEIQRLARTVREHERATEQLAQIVADQRRVVEKVCGKVGMCPRWLLAEVRKAARAMARTKVLTKARNLNRPTRELDARHEHATDRP